MYYNDSNDTTVDNISANSKQKYNGKYDAVLMDFNMPKMDGPGATKQLRKLGYRGPIIGVTGNVLDEDKRVFIEAGADKVLFKPLDTGLLETTLSNCYR